MQLAGVRRRGRTLARVVKEIPDRLVGDEQAQQPWVTTPGEYPEQRRSLRVVSLARKRGERVPGPRPPRHSEGAGAPNPGLARDDRHPPHQTTAHHADEGPERSLVQGRRSSCLKSGYSLIIEWRR